MTVNVSAVLTTFISAVSSNDSVSTLTALQLLWINLIMDTIAALALATDSPTPELLLRPPIAPRAPLIDFNMWKMVFLILILDCWPSAFSDRSKFILSLYGRKPIS